MKIKSLNEEIQLVQIEKFATDFNNAMKKEHKKTLKRLLVLLIPTMIFILGITIFHNPIILFIGFLAMGIAYRCDYIIENDIKIKENSNDCKNENIISIK